MTQSITHETAEGAKPEIEVGAGTALVVAASSAGTAFEWYDFFIFGSLAPLISKAFFSGVNDSAALIFALGVFGAGFAFRPLGALVFGWVGDKVGRKAAFLVTITLMGLATISIGFLPTYAQAGLLAPALLIGMRIVQGFALGGQYGGAAVYVAEHAPANKRGLYTGWIQITASLGLIGALTVILVTRQAMSPAAFADWGWRIPFVCSAALLGVSLFIRAKLGESPAFKKMTDEGGGSKAPLAEAFLRWRHLKLVLIALFSILFAQGAVWYTAFFYAQFFLEKVLGMDGATVNLVMVVVTVISAPFYVIFAGLSDVLGRKPVMLFGIILAAVAFIPGFHELSRAANPALAAATERTPVTVIADPADCSVQFDPVGKTAFLSSCDIAKSLLAGAGVSYGNQAAPAGAQAVVQVGAARLAVDSARGLPPAKATAAKAAAQARVRAALAAAGYPKSADPKSIDWIRLYGVMMVFAIAATALYGPMAASLVEMFPTRIRYTALSLPYNIGTGWIGGFLPAVAFALVAVNGNMYFGLWYPVIIAGATAVVGLLFLPETRGKDIHAD